MGFIRSARQQQEGGILPLILHSISVSLHYYPQQQSFCASQSAVRALAGQFLTSPEGAPQQNSPSPVHVDPAAVAFLKLGVAR